MKNFGVKACALRSGSSGNSIFIGCNQTRLLVDAGISAKSIEQSLRAIGETASDLNGILVTHEHSDHIAGVGVPTLITRAVRTPARMTGTARGSSMRVSTWNPEYPMPLPASM